MAARYSAGQIGAGAASSTLQIIRAEQAGNKQTGIVTNYPSLRQPAGRWLIEAEIFFTHTKRSWPNDLQVHPSSFRLGICTQTQPDRTAIEEFAAVAIRRH